MKLRRVHTDDGAVAEYQNGDGSWDTLGDNSALGGSPFDEQWVRSVDRRHRQASDLTLPFHPVSFRDFLLHEQHNIAASRGLVRRFHPGQFRATAVVEKLTGRPFPKFKPAKLFYEQPIYYMSNHLTFVPSGTPVKMPSYSRALDYELEIGFVLSAPLRNASPAEATAAIGSFVLLNDFSARDVQRREMASGFGPQKSKHFGSSMSSTAVTADEVVPRINDLTGTVALNGEVVSRVNSAGMQWSLGEMLAHASRDEQLLPGELFGTGTLPGGSGMETGNWLSIGDTLTLTLDDIGTVEHKIIG